VRPIQAIADDVDEGVEIERLEDRVAHRIGRDLVHAPLSRGGEHDDVRSVLPMTAVDLLDEFVAVQARHHQVEEDEVVPGVVLQNLQPGGAILGERDLEFHPLQYRLQQHANRKVVVNDQDSASGSVELVNGHNRDAMHCPAMRMAYRSEALLSRIE